MSKSDDEDFRRNRRRRQNREAASRCRQRKRDLSSNLIKEYQGLQSTNTQLLHEIRVLQKQQQTLNDCFSRHIDSCSSAAIYRTIPTHTALAVANRSGKSSSTTAGGGGGGGGDCAASASLPLATESTGLPETSSISRTAAELAFNPILNGMNLSSEAMSTTLSVGSTEEFQREVWNYLRHGTGSGRCRPRKHNGVDYRVPVTSEPRIFLDVVTASDSTAERLSFSFKEIDDDVMSGDSNLSTKSVGLWLKDV